MVLITSKNNINRKLCKVHRKIDEVHIIMGYRLHEVIPTIADWCSVPAMHHGAPWNKRYQHAFRRRLVMSSRQYNVGNVLKSILLMNVDEMRPRSCSRRVDFLRGWIYRSVVLKKVKGRLWYFHCPRLTILNPDVVADLGL